jgi:hypothetical protein
MKLKIIRFFWRSLAVYNLYSITTNQAAIIALFRVVNRYVGTSRRCRACFLITRRRWSATPTPAANLAMEWTRRRFDGRFAPWEGLSDRLAPPSAGEQAARPPYDDF